MVWRRSNIPGLHGVWALWYLGGCSLCNLLVVESYLKGQCILTTHGTVPHLMMPSGFHFVDRGKTLCRRGDKCRSLWLVTSWPQCSTVRLYIPILHHIHGHTGFCGHNDFPNLRQEHMLVVTNDLSLRVCPGHGQLGRAKITRRSETYFHKRTVAGSSAYAKTLFI